MFSPDCSICAVSSRKKFGSYSTDTSSKEGLVIAVALHFMCLLSKIIVFKQVVFNNNVQSNLSVFWCVLIRYNNSYLRIYE